MAENNDKGKLGEDIACGELVKHGYEILAKNYRSTFGEIDIIAKKDFTVAFVEVKLRKSTAMGMPKEFVTKSKQKKIIATAMKFLSENNFENYDFRFDVAEILYNNKIKFNYIENAFWAED